ncbi:MAG TPA: periplasmic heavy metal sensor [Dyella sp.]|uniref:periplasmic heavy metal sensor n=1 Tax=Dyella sp. TaxID=1869338 RepID=UPI002F94C137
MIGRTAQWGVSVLVGCLVGALLAGGAMWVWHRPGHHPSDLHTMLHDAVPLDSQEQQRLDADETAFLAQRAAIEDRLRAANGKLADAIVKDPSWSPEVEAATREVERAAADLQRATLVHLFEMRAGLKPEHRAAYDHELVEALRRSSR